MKSKLLIGVLVACLALSICGLAFAAELTDIKGHWAQPQIEKLVTAGAVYGYADGTFKPDAKVNRAEFAAMVNNAFKKFDQNAKASFSDVVESDWFYAHVASAKAAGYMKGDPNNTFRPNSPINRAEAAAVLAQLTKLDTSKTDGITAFTDAQKIESWAKGSIAAVLKAKIMSGYSDGSFKPASAITRAEAVVAIDNAMSYKAPVADDDSGGSGGSSSGGGGSDNGGGGDSNPAPTLSGTYSVTPVEGAPVATSEFGVTVTGLTGAAKYSLNTKDGATIATLNLNEKIRDLAIMFADPAKLEVKFYDANNNLLATASLNADKTLTITLYTPPTVPVLAGTYSVTPVEGVPVSTSEFGVTVTGLTDAAKYSLNTKDGATIATLNLNEKIRDLAIMFADPAKLEVKFYDTNNTLLATAVLNADKNLTITRYTPPTVPVLAGTYSVTPVEGTPVSTSEFGVTVSGLTGAAKYSLNTKDGATIATMNLNEKIRDLPIMFADPAKLEVNFYNANNNLLATATLDGNGGLVFNAV